MNLLFVAAENGALPAGKVGGMGDVIRDLPKALAELGHSVTVATPSYGHFHTLPGSTESTAIQTRFRDRDESLRLFTLAKRQGDRGVVTHVLEHPMFSACGRGTIYCTDSDDQPFARDSEKFALFSAAVAHGLASGRFGDIDVVHLHDWHVATVATLLKLHPGLRRPSQAKIAFTVHNLAMQGVRPLSGTSASLYQWFPDLPFSADYIDPRYPDCYNPLRAGLRLSDAVNTVSPTYVEEICHPENGMSEGLGADLEQLKDSGRLHGILNGCEYPKRLPQPMSADEFLQTAKNTLFGWMGNGPVVQSAHAIALERIRERQQTDQQARFTVTCVGRLTDQKLGLLTHRLADGRIVLEHLLDILNDDEEMILLGAGDAAFESTLVAAMAASPKLLFLRGYSDAIAEQLYVRGVLFLMPSLFEPCGIAQMIAMRSGQPCLVNKTGGLADTINDDVDGFVFSGADRGELASAMVTRFRQAMTRVRRHKRKYAAMRDSASKARFQWRDAANAYVELLYR